MTDTRTTAGPLECADGAPHVWEFAGGKGQRRCSVCFVHGYVVAIRSEYDLGQPRDSQGVAFRRCEKVVDREKCGGWAVARDPTTPGGQKRKWRCRHHRTKWGTAE